MTLQSIKPEIMHKVSSNRDTYIGHKADMSGSTCITWLGISTSLLKLGILSGEHILNIRILL